VCGFLPFVGADFKETSLIYDLGERKSLNLKCRKKPAQFDSAFASAKYKKLDHEGTQRKLIERSTITEQNYEFSFVNLRAP
jgi:formyltetrahydrofolate synthetase